MKKLSEEILKDAKKLYNEGKWNESISFIETLFFSHDKQKVAEANQIKAWAYHYLGIKGNESYKTENLEKAEEHFKLSLVGAKKDETKVSVLNGLPLSLWILGKKEEAWEISNKAIGEFEKIPSVWNTRSILARWGKEYKKSVEICQKVYEIALAEEDFRTAGHGKHNRADALKELGKLGEAKKDYQESLKLYKKYEKESGESAKFHIDKVEEKISNL